MQLYNIMQQINNDNNYLIALENKKDSRAMKTISIVTMIFLPGTAIAVRPPANPVLSPPHPFQTSRLLSKKLKIKKPDHLQHGTILHLLGNFVGIHRFHPVLDLLGRGYSADSRRAADMAILDGESGEKGRC